MSSSFKKLLLYTEKKIKGEDVGPFVESDFEKELRKNDAYEARHGMDIGWRSEYRYDNTNDALYMSLVRTAWLCHLLISRHSSMALRKYSKKDNLYRLSKDKNNGIDFSINENNTVEFHIDKGLEILLEELKLITTSDGNTFNTRKGFEKVVQALDRTKECCIQCIAFFRLKDVKVSMNINEKKDKKTKYQVEYEDAKVIFIIDVNNTLTEVLHGGQDKHIYNWLNEIQMKT